MFVCMVWEYDKYIETNKVHNTTEVIVVTVKNRIVAIRLSGKLDRNPEYAKKLGISVENGKTEKLKEHVQSNRENDYYDKGR